MNIDRIEPKPVKVKYMMELTIDEFNVIETAVDLLFKSTAQLYPQATPAWITQISTMKAQINTTN